MNKRKGYWWKSETANCYLEITSAKRDSLDENIKLKDLLDLWWNSVRLRTKEGIKTLYKDYKGDYELEDLDKDILSQIVHTDCEYNEDGDGYPIIYATL